MGSLLLLLLTAGCGGRGFLPEGRAIPAAEGKARVELIPPGQRRPAPSLAGEEVRGGRVELRAGRVALVNFWASWCGPCRREQPELVRLFARYGERVFFLGVNVRDSRENARAYLDEFSVPYPSLFDPAARSAAAFAVPAIPTTYLVDAKGRIAARIVGASTEEELAPLLDSLLAEGG